MRQRRTLRPTATSTGVGLLGRLSAGMVTAALRDVGAHRFDEIAIEKAAPVEIVWSNGCDGFSERKYGARFHDQSTWKKPASRIDTYWAAQLSNGFAASPQLRRL